MLVNPRFTRNHTIDQILTALGQGGDPVCIQTGIFISPSFSFGNSIGNTMEEYADFGNEFKSSFGVSDDIDQVLKEYKQWLDDPTRKFCISFTKVEKSEQPSDGGWRWHKWGPYIGTKNPQCEYLYDEGDDITEVYVYHIYELLD